MNRGHKYGLREGVDISFIIVSLRPLESNLQLWLGGGWWILESWE